jgi:hypothetical protein
MAEQTQQEIEDAIRNQFLTTHEGKSATQENDAASLGGVAPQDFVPPLSVEDQIRKRAEEDLGAGGIDVQAINAEAAKEAAAKEASDRENTTWWENAYGNVKNKALGVGEEDAGAIASGAAAGYALPKIINEFDVTPTANKENEEKYKAQKDFLKTANPTEQNILKKSEIAHETKLLDLKDQQYAAKEEMEKSAKDLEKARLKHDLTKRINVDDFLPPEMKSTYTPPIETLTQLPIGGKAAQNYDIAHGGTEMEALLSPSTSQVQKDLPERAERSNKIREIAPEFQRVAESPLLLAEEGRKAKLEELNKPPPKEDDQVKKLKESIAKKQAEAQAKLEKAQAAHDANIKALSKINADLAAHQETAPTTFRQQENAEAERKAIQAQEEWNKKYGGGNAITRGASFIGRKFFPRLSPIVAGAIAPEQAMEAKRLYDKGEYGKALAYGTGALGSVGMATGIPWVSGVGALAQFPALYFEGEDLFSPPKP